MTASRCTSWTAINLLFARNNAGRQLSFRQLNHRNGASRGVEIGLFLLLTVSLLGSVAWAQGQASKKSTGNVKFADEYPGSKPAEQIDAAGADCGGSACIVIVPPHMQYGTPSRPLPNVTYIDLRAKALDEPRVYGVNIWDGNNFTDCSACQGGFARAKFNVSAAQPAGKIGAFIGEGAVALRFFAAPGESTGSETVTNMLFTRTGTDTLTQRGFLNADETEGFFAGSGLNIYDFRGLTVNMTTGVNVFGPPSGTVGTVREIVAQEQAALDSTKLHIANWSGVYASAPGLPVANNTLSGTVNTRGTLVTWVSGDKFSDRGMTGYPIKINGRTYVITSVPNSVSMTLNADAGAQGSAPYTFRGSQYSVYAEGPLWLNAGSAGTAADPLGGGGIMLDTCSSCPATGMIWVRDHSTRLSDGTYGRKGIRVGDGASQDLQIVDSTASRVVLAMSDAGALKTATNANTDLAGQCVLGVNCEIRFHGAYNSPPICVATDTSAESPVRVQTNTTGLLITGAPRHNVNYVCVGRD